MSSVQLSPESSLNNLLLSSLSGYVLAVIMMAIIIILGVGITLGYFYKRWVHTHMHAWERPQSGTEN